MLYILEFKFNLISISKLSSCLHCSLTFSTNHCHIQDIKSRKMVGLVKKSGGLHYLVTNHDKGYQVNSLNTQVSTFGTTTISDCDLWHYKLRHLSVNRLIYLVNNSLASLLVLMNLVMCVSLLNKRGCHINLVVVELHVIFIYCILTCGGHLALPQYMDIDSS